MSTERPAHLERQRSLAQRQRDAAFSRIGRVRRWTIVAAAALTAGFAALVSALTPGRSLGASARAPHSSPPPVASTGASQRMPPPASPTQLGLQGPSQPPSAAPPASSDQGSSGDAPQSSPQPAAPPAPASPAPSSGAVSGGS